MSGYCPPSFHLRPSFWAGTQRRSICVRSHCVRINARLWSTRPMRSSPARLAFGFQALWCSSCTGASSSKCSQTSCPIPVNGYHVYPSSLVDSAWNWFVISAALCREAVRQRKALSRTSSNILLNSVHMGQTQQPTSLSYLHPSDIDLNAKSAREETNSALSNLEVSLINFITLCKGFKRSP